MPQLDAHKSHMNDRDERGRLKLPSTTYIPFQRVQNRPNRSITNSRRQSPDHEHKNARTSRSHSFNVSELGNSHDEDKDGYYYDHDQDHKGGKPRRNRSKHREVQDNDVERKFSHLSLGNGNKTRSRSLSHEHESTTTKMPYIPFQRVLHIRTRPIAREPDSGFKVPSFTDLKDRRDFRFRYDSKMRTDGFTTEYRSRFKQKKKGMKGRRKITTWKNDSHVKELLKENDVMGQNNHKDTESEDENEDEEHNQGSDEETKDYNSLSPQGSQHSESSNSRNGLGNDSRSASSSSSVKFPQIRQSPLSSSESVKSVTGSGALPSSRKSSISISESARSVKGAGAIPPSQKSSLSITESARSVRDTGAIPASQKPNQQSKEDSSYSPNQLLLAKVQPVETSKWVEGKGAGRLSQFFPLLKPSEKEGHRNTEPAIYTEKVYNQYNQHIKAKNLSYTESSYQLPVAKTLQKTYPQVQLKALHSQHTTNARSHTMKNQKTVLVRSKSDSSLYAQVNKTEPSSSNPESLKPNEIVIFTEEVTNKTVNVGSRPKTTLPRIILTLPEEQTFIPQVKEPDNKDSQIRTRVPSLPQINSTITSQTHQNFQQRTSISEKSYSNFTRDWKSQQNMNSIASNSHTNQTFNISGKYSNSRSINNTNRYQNANVPIKNFHPSSVNNKNRQQYKSVLQKNTNQSSFNNMYRQQSFKVPQTTLYSSSRNTRYNNQSVKVSERTTYSSSMNNKLNNKSFRAQDKTTYSSSMNNKFSHQSFKGPEKTIYSSPMNNNFSHKSFKVPPKQPSYNQKQWPKSRHNSTAFTPYNGFKAKLRHNASKKHNKMPFLNKAVYQRPSYGQIQPSSLKARTSLTHRDPIPLPNIPRRYSQGYRSSPPPSQYSINNRLSVQTDTAVPLLDTPRRYSQSYRNSPPPLQYSIYDGLKVQRDTAIHVQGNGGYSNNTKRHVEDIKRRRRTRLQGFLHLLGQKVTKDANYEQQPKERGFTARLTRSDLMMATF